MEDASALLLKRQLTSSPVMMNRSKNLKLDLNLIEQEASAAVALRNCSLEKSPKERPLMVSSCIVTNTELNAFLALLDEDQHIYDFLNYDACCRLADKYLLAMVFVYFKRAGLRFKEYTRINFFVALYLAHDMEEDEEELKYEILYWAMGKNWPLYTRKFLKRRNHLWKRMKYRAIVSCRMCHDLISLLPYHYAWQRHRPLHHAGAIRCYPKADRPPPSLLRDPFASPPVCRLCQSLEDSVGADSSGDLLNLVDSSQIHCDSSSKDVDYCLDEQKLAESIERDYKMTDAFEFFGRFKEE